MLLGNYSLHFKDMGSTVDTPRVTVFLPPVLRTYVATMFGSFMRHFWMFTLKSPGMWPLLEGMDLQFQRQMSTVLKGASHQGYEKMKFSWVFHESRDSGQLEYAQLQEDNPLLATMISLHASPSLPSRSPSLKDLQESAHSIALV